MPETIAQKPAKRFMSLKLKWALGTAVGTLLVSIVVIVAIFSFFTHDLLDQEQDTMDHEMTVISQKLKDINAPLTEDNVHQVLAKEAFAKPERKDSTSVYHRPLLQGLSNSRLNFFVYDRSGKEVFATGKALRPFVNPQRSAISLVRGPQHRIMFGRMPIVDHKGQRIGYLQVEDQLNNYHNLYHRLLLVMLMALCVVFVFSGLIGYFLSWFLLRPINDLQSAMAVVTKDPTKDVRVPETDRNDELSEMSHLFNEMLDQTQRYIDAQSQFVGDVSHELRTPVAIIQGHMEMLDRWGKDDPKILNESIKASLAETQRMNNLVKEMLDLSRADQANLNYHNATTNVREVVQQVFNDFKMLHTDFVFILDDDLKTDLPVKIYRDHLEQILVILCDNAVKYSTDRKEIHLSLSRNFDSAEIGVQDFGEGISADQLDRVFDRFYRVDKARTRKRGGNGLGLSIAKRLIENYHGTITVESQVGSGSLFRVTIPIAKKPDNQK
ncbi:HAMP domain-containing sensor histidine kinase [Limosilactobacillus secaliphilus]|uniref:Signal transduction histidine-protein kinase ArlS n=1 Tax=Limosilactobacillus secaliphilus TaxID=396268 RepID=A0A0R2IC76_9LACO|nr:HAMP domain-containing histidine kinase [Limosilactobacillus secaliphilus]KRN59149.1 phosphate regulon sensor kinase PhoR [Limosilactobacillus secaliphilus]